jgi:hypothetical protein
MATYHDQAEWRSDVLSDNLLISGASEPDMKVTTLYAIDPQTGLEVGFFHINQNFGKIFINNEELWKYCSGI